MRTTSMHFVNSLHSYLSSKVENRLLGMNERNYSLGDTFKVTLECELKAIASERWHNKCNAVTTNQVEVIQPQTLLQPKEINEVHVCNPNYKGKNYDPNFQAKCVEATHTASYNSKQPQQSSTTGNQYKPTYNEPAPTYNNSNSNAPLTSVINFRALLPHMYGDSNKLFQCFVELVFFYFLFAHNIYSKLQHCFNIFKPS